MLSLASSSIEMELVACTFCLNEVRSTVPTQQACYNVTWITAERDFFHFTQNGNDFSRKIQGKMEMIRLFSLDFGRSSCVNKMSVSIDWDRARYRTPCISRKEGNKSGQVAHGQINRDYDKKDYNILHWMKSSSAIGMTADASMPRTTTHLTESGDPDHLCWQYASVTQH